MGLIKSLITPLIPVYKLLPSSFRHAVRARFLNEFLHRRAERLWNNNLDVKYVYKFLQERYGLEVQHGPFQGMKYIDQAINSGFYPKIVGCYEDELHPALDMLLERDYKQIIDIGAAEGYYAVGMACRYPEATRRFMPMKWKREAASL